MYDRRCATKVICNKPESSYVFAAFRILTSNKSNRFETLGDVQQSQLVLFSQLNYEVGTQQTKSFEKLAGLHCATKPSLPNIRLPLTGKTLGSLNFKYLTD
jgi:hypothetical protein